MSKAGSVLPPYINGRFVAVQKPERTFQAVNPAKPADILAVMAWDKDWVSDIVDGMKSAQASFGALPHTERLAHVMGLVRCLIDNADEIKSKMMLELGRTRIAVEEEWRLCESFFEILPTFCQDVLSEKVDRGGWSWQYAPVGLVLVSSNVALPVYSVLSTALPSLVAGNAVAIRPSLHCPLTGTLIASCVHQAAFPPGLVQIIYGDLEVYRRLILTQQFDTVLYTGGEESLEQIRRDLSTSSQTRLVLCSGGKNAAFVLDSCNVQDAVEKVLYGMCIDCGQRLEATGLVFVSNKLLAEFSEKFVAAVKTMPIGSKDDLALDNGPFMGPLCSATSRERFLRFQGIAARESDETLRWGKTIDKPGNGYFVSPGVHLMQPKKVLRSVYASNAFFGPDVCLVPVDSEEEGIAILNSLGASRSLAVHSGFEEQVREIRSQSHVPTVMWNAPTTALEPHLPTTGRGRAGNSIVTGVRFLFSTVFPKTLNLKDRLAGSTTLWALPLVCLTNLAAWMYPEVSQADYRKAVEGNEVVKAKLYPKAGKFQLNALQGGTILNQSFIDTYLITASATYHFNEWHAINVEGFFGLSNDRAERQCIESFFKDEARAKPYTGGLVCDPEGIFNAKDRPANEVNPDGRPADQFEKDKQKHGPYQLKPAYMPIRQVNQILGVNYQWTPVYGKALWFLTATGYLDFYLTTGLGVTLSTYWPLRTQTATQEGKTDPATGEPLTIRDHGTDERTETGEAGRPQALEEVSPTVSFGIGNRFFFAKNFAVNMEVRNFTVIQGSTETWMNFFALWGGLGIMF